MNKPIIVDGVDVSGCEDLTNQLCCEQYLSGECEGQDCYYKQLQLLKAENEELKKAKDEYYLNNLYYERKLSELTQVLEEVREIINFRFKTPYMKLGLKETDKIIEDIEKIINEVLKDE